MEPPDKSFATPARLLCYASLVQAQARSGHGQVRENPAKRLPITFRILSAVLRRENPRQFLARCIVGNAAIGRNFPISPWPQRCAIQIGLRLHPAARWR